MLHVVRIIRDGKVLNRKYFSQCKIVGGQPNSHTLKVCFSPMDDLLMIISVAGKASPRSTTIWVTASTDRLSMRMSDDTSLQTQNSQTALNIYVFVPVSCMIRSCFGILRFCLWLQRFTPLAASAETERYSITSVAIDYVRIDMSCRSRCVNRCHPRTALPRRNQS